MMKIYTSYFYQVRFFTPNMVPISTAKFDPKWFKRCIDKNGVMNGLKARVFAPGPECEGLCRGPQNCLNLPDNCPFLKTYWNQLSKLNFKDILERTQNLCNRVCAALECSEEPIAVFLFHEAPNNPCSERIIFQKWFAENGLVVPEWKKI